MSVSKHCLRAYTPRGFHCGGLLCPYLLMNSPKNKTIDISADEYAALIGACITADSPMSPEACIDKTVCGDAFAVLGFLPRGFFDLLIADPPYNLDKTFDGEKFRKTAGEDYARYTGRWLDAALPLLKKTASVYVCCDWRSSPYVFGELQKRLIVRNRITWQREKGRGCLKNWKNSMEDIWFCTVSDDYVFNLDKVRIRRRVLAPYRKDGKPKDWQATERGNFRDTCPSNFWDDITVPYWSMPENTPHPTQKPEKLIAKLILASSNPGDAILDPFLGSGTTSVTAKKLARLYTGIELSARYCALAEKRLQSVRQNDVIQGYSDGVFWERNTFANQHSASKKRGGPRIT